MKSLLWYGVLISITTAYCIAMAGVYSAKNHRVSQHSGRMMLACSIVGLWLVLYVSKQLIFGREVFGGTTGQYWSIYMPIFSVHMLLAVSTISLGFYNLYIGRTRLKTGTGGGAMSASVSRHRLTGKILVWTFSGTMITAYMVYWMLFIGFQPA